MSSKNQTAVEWLVEQIEGNILWNDKAREMLEQAKGMEKEQIKEAYYKPLSNEYWHKGEQWLNEESEIYFIETYGS